MTEKVLITGDAGFIYWGWVDALLEAVYEVRVHDSAEPQLYSKLGERGQ